MPHILLVDDELLNRRLFQRVFRNELDLKVASSGCEALSLIGAHIFDLCFSDFSMPGMDGLEFIEKALGVRPALPFVMVTGYGSHPRVQAALQTRQVQAVISKPWNPDQIRAVLRTHARGES